MKNEIRKTTKTWRREMDKSEVSQKSELIAEYFLASDIYKRAGCIMLYMPIGNEADTKKIIDAAFCDKKRVVLPITDFESGKITPVLIKADSKFKRGAFSVPEPQEIAKIDPLKIDVVVVPGIAFDRGGARIGFGKGCYDGFLKGIESVKVGLCYDFQIYPNIPIEEHDIRMDWLVSESGIKKCEKEAL